MDKTIPEKIEQADMVLVGIGEEFNNVRRFRQRKAYRKTEEALNRSEAAWLLPAYESYCRGEKDHEVSDGLCRLAERLKDKNYFVVSVSTNDEVADVPWKEGRLVMPCGSWNRKQCARGCSDVLCKTGEEDKKVLNHYFTVLEEKAQDEEELPLWTQGAIGVCPVCGSPLVLNNIYADVYNEKGYLEQWETYRKWLQGTLNRKLLILELGVGLKFPSVIRWPFEKIAFFQQKAEFYRVNEKLYQLSEELKGKGVSIAKNSIDWLQIL